MKNANSDESKMKEPEKYENAGNILYSKCDEIAEKVIEMQYSEQPELHIKYGEKGKKKSYQDCKHHLFYLGEALCLSSKTLFIDYVLWSKTLIESLGIPGKYLVTNLELASKVLEGSPEINMAREELEVSLEYLSAGIAAFHTSNQPIESYIDTGSRFGKLTESYTYFLLDGKKQNAAELIFGLLDSGVSVEEIYLEVFQPSQYEIGRLWQTNEISVAQEHYATASTQLIMSQLYPYILSDSKKESSLVATCIGSELHELGVRMVADFFEMDGWDSYYLGANTPSSSVIQEVKDKKAQLLIVSATLTIHVHKVKQMISELKSSDALDSTKIMVGGYPFNIDPCLWKKVGADLYAPDARKAVEIANEVVNKTV